MSCYTLPTELQFTIVGMCLAFIIVMLILFAREYIDSKLKKLERDIKDDLR